MRSVNKKIIWLFFIISLLACGYSVLGAIMTAWLSAVPNGPNLENLQFRFYMWGIAVFIFLCLSVIFFILV